MITKDSKRILIADDSEFFRVRLGDILTEAGHEVIFASGGQEALERIKQAPGRIDLMLLDLHMPGLDGFGVLKWMLESEYKGRFPVLASTAFYEPGEILEKVKALGASGLVPKSVSPEQMVFRVNAVLFSDKAVGGSQRRRVPCSIPADFSVGEASYSGVVLNVSETGLFLHTDLDLLVGAFIRIKFSIPGSETLTEARGNVRWVTGDASKKTILGGAGINFTSISEADTKIIASFVEAEAARLGLESLEAARAETTKRAV